MSAQGTREGANAQPRKQFARLAGPGPAAPRRVVHRLTATQQRAVDRLNALGADLAPGFSAAELLRAYRRLALRYHPDRNVEARPAERAQRSRQFADVAESCRCLRSLFEPRH